MPNIGSVALKNNIILAPLAGVSDYPLRQLSRDFGVGLTYTEMISAEGIYRNNHKSKHFTFVKNEHPICAQIFGNNPDVMAYAASYFEDQGADIIDINFGCPVPKVAKQGSGAALARNTKQAVAIISSVRKALSVPLTIKMRLGWSAAEENYLELSRQAEKEGVNAICLHPRYATQMYTGQSNWDKLLLLKQQSKIPIIGSGDIKKSIDITNHLSQYGADYIMIGRGLLGNPWLISEYLQTPPKHIKDTIELHFKYMVDFHGEAKAAKLFRKFISKYLKHFSNAKELKGLGNKLSGLLDLQNLLGLINV